MGVGVAIDADPGCSLAHAISGFVFEDAPTNNDIIDPADAVVANMDIELFRDVNNDGVPQPEELIAATVSTTTGAYSFRSLPDGRYLVRLRAPAIASTHADIVRVFAMLCIVAPNSRVHGSTTAC